MSKVYTIGPIRQLIDLNGSSINFEVEFRAVSQNGEPFQGVIVDQTVLNTNPDFQYQPSVNGVISGSLKQDQNVQQTYYLVLRAEKDVPVEVSIVKKELPLTEQTVEPEKPAVWPAWVRYVIIAAVVGVGLYMLYKVYSKPKKSNVEPLPAAIAMAAPPTAAPSAPPTSAPTLPPLVPPPPLPPTVGSSVLDRLKQLNLPK